MEPDTVSAVRTSWKFNAFDFKYITATNKNY
jgi:hypothetical protein